MSTALHAFLADPAVFNAAVIIVGGVFSWAYARVQGQKDAKLKIDIDQQTNAGLIQAIERAVFSALSRGGAPAAIPSIVADTISQRMPEAIARVVDEKPAAARVKLVGLAEDATARILAAQAQNAAVMAAQAPAAPGAGL